jgi:hypothetical protein
MHAGLYTIEYTEGDVEDMDLEEYNYAYALWLREEGWQVEEGDVPEELAITKKPQKVRLFFF